MHELINMPNFKLSIVTNIPSLIIDVFSGTGAWIVKGKCTQSDGVTYVAPSTTDIDLSKGIYNVRLSVPYYNDGGTMFPMPLYMNEPVRLDKDVTLTFKTHLTHSR